MTGALRKKLERRTKLWNTKQRPPSEIKSERLRKKLSRGQPVSVVRQTDCRGCSKYPCGKTLEVCEEESRAERCAQCGVKVLYRYIASEIYYCPICVSRRRWHRILCAHGQGVIIEYHITRRKIHTVLGIAQSVNTKLKRGCENQNNVMPRKLRTRLWLRWLSERL